MTPDEFVKLKIATIQETMECARQIVQAYGPCDLPEVVRSSLCQMMLHYENAACKNLEVLREQR